MPIRVSPHNSVLEQGNLWVSHEKTETRRIAPADHDDTGRKGYITVDHERPKNNRQMTVDQNDVQRHVDSV